GLELLRELPRLRAEVEAEPLEEAAGVLFLELDPDTPVVPRHDGVRLPAFAPSKSHNRRSCVSHASRFARYPQKRGKRGRRPPGERIWHRASRRISSGSGRATRTARCGSVGSPIRTSVSGS